MAPVIPVPPVSQTARIFEDAILILFNLPVLALMLRLPFIADLKQALKEKNGVGGDQDTTSYSRVTGLVGAVIITSFFWAIGNVIVFKAFEKVDDIRQITDHVGPFFLIGSALFLPYAFNQIKAAFVGMPAPGLPFSTPVGAAAAVVSTTGGNEAVAAVAAAPTPAPGPPAAPAPAASNLVVVIANLSTTIDDPTFAAAVAAIGIQVTRDFQPEWGAGAVLSATRLDLAGGQANINTAVDAIIYVGDASADPTTGTAGAYGYHSQNYGKIPYAFIYLDVCAQYGEAWSCTLSHEVLEMLADPTTQLTATGPAPPGAATPSVNYDLEVCDPTQGDTYVINNVTVSNFVTKAYFGMVGGASTGTNFMGLALTSFGTRPGGYFQYEDAAGAHQVNGAKVDAQRLAARAMLAGYRRNARRVAPLRGV